MKFVELTMAFLIVMLLGFITLGFVSTQPTLNNSTAAGQQQENLTKVTELTMAGYNGALLLFIVAIILSALFLIIWAVMR